MGGADIDAAACAWRVGAPVLMLSPCQERGEVHCCTLGGLFRYPEPSVV